MRDRLLPPTDQADGLRRLFAASRMRFVPLLSNPHLAFGGLIIDRLVAACGEAVRHTLVVDASATPVRRIALGARDLAASIEALTPQASVLAARGLARRYVASNGSGASFLHALADAAPHAQLVLVHADALELSRMFADRPVRPIVLAADRPAAVTHAYAGIKLLVQRAQLMTHDLVFAASARSPRIERIAERLASCADMFLGAVVRDWAAIDPACDDEQPPPALRRIALDAAGGDEAWPTPGLLPARPAAARPATALHLN